MDKRSNRPDFKVEAGIGQRNSLGPTCSPAGPKGKEVLRSIETPLEAGAAPVRQTGEWGSGLLVSDFEEMIVPGARPASISTAQTHTVIF